MRKFYLRRLEDETGISGTGVVTEGYQYEVSGICVMRWLTETSSVAIYKSIDDVITIHGHQGKTVVEWADETVPLLQAPRWVHSPFEYFLYLAPDEL